MIKKTFFKDKMYSTHVFLSSLIYYVLLKKDTSSFYIILSSVAFFTAVKIITNTCEILAFARFLKSEEN